MLLCLIIIGIICTIYKVTVWPIVAVLVLSVFIPIIIDVILKKEYLPNQKEFTPYITGIKGSFVAGIINFSLLPYKAYISADAIIRAIYRLAFSKQNLLEWTTSEEAEKSSAVGLNQYINLMKINSLAGIISLIWMAILNINLGIIIMMLASILWIIAPVIAWYISQEKEEDNKYKLLNKEEQKYIYDLGKKTWEYFYEYMNEENNYLPPDNYQENRKEKVVYRTSPTNIGMGLISNVVALDLGYIVFEDALSRIEKIISSMLLLETYNGHFLNWYDTKTRKPLYPRYISTVDSGNLLACLLIVKEVLNDYKKNTIFTKKHFLLL